jgi:hypothetical protein
VTIWFPRTPGVTVDIVDVAAGLEQARQFGYDAPERQMVAEYALMRHPRGGKTGPSAAHCLAAST